MIIKRKEKHFGGNLSAETKRECVIKRDRETPGERRMYVSRVLFQHSCDDGNDDVDTNSIDDTGDSRDNEGDDDGGGDENGEGDGHDDGGGGGNVSNKGSDGGTWDHDSREMIVMMVMMIKCRRL